MKLYQGSMVVNDKDELLRKLPDGCVLIDADYVVSLDVVEFAVRKALKTWDEGARISKSLSMEILIHLAGTRQINQAIQLGIKDGVNRVVVVDLNGCIEILRENGFKEENVVKTNPEREKKIIEFYGIGKEELEVVGEKKLKYLIMERIALFSAMKLKSVK